MVIDSCKFSSISYSCPTLCAACRLIVGRKGLRAQIVSHVLSLPRIKGMGYLWRTFKNIKWSGRLLFQGIISTFAWKGFGKFTTNRVSTPKFTSVTWRTQTRNITHYTATFRLGFELDNSGIEVRFPEGSKDPLPSVRTGCSLSPGVKRQRREVDHSLSCSTHF
jgi:hypothetical protein